MEQIQKEKEENVGGKKPTEKNMKLYMVCSFVAGLCMAFFIANLIGGCDERHEVNNTARYANVERAINDVMREKEIVDGMKVDGTWKHGMDSIGIFEKEGKRGFYNLNTNKVLVPANYTHAWFFSEGLAAVEKDGKIGFINMKGKLVIPHKFIHRTNDHPDIAFSNGMCVIANGNGQFGNGRTFDHNNNNNNSNNNHNNGNNHNGNHNNGSNNSHGTRTFGSHR